MLWGRREFHSGHALALMDGDGNEVAVLAAPLFFVGVEVTEAERLPTRIRLFAAGVFGWCACCVLGAESETLRDLVAHALAYHLGCFCCYSLWGGFIMW